MNPAFLDNMSWEMAEVYGAITDQILVNLAHYFPYYKPGDPLPRTSFEYQSAMLAQMGKVNADTVRIIRNGLADADDALKDVLEQAIIDGVRKIEPELLKAVQQGIIRPAGTPVVSADQMRAFQLYYNQSATKLNLVNTVMLESTMQAYKGTVSSIVSEMELSERMNRVQIALDTSAGETITGVSTWNQAMRHGIDRLKENGITGFIDHAGRRWSAESYVAMDVRTTVYNTGRAAVWETNESFGNDLYIVSYHDGARPLCYPWQNKVISSTDTARTVQDLDGNEIRVYAQSETTYGQAAGLFGINCKHYPSPFIPGVSVAYDQSNIQDEAENEKVYEQTQEQRGLERKIREQKRDWLMAKAQNASADELRALRDDIRQTSAQIDEFCDKTGLPRRKNREGVYTKREFPAADTYDPRTFANDQKKIVDEYFGGGGAQQGYTFGQMTPKQPVQQTKTEAIEKPTTVKQFTPAKTIEEAEKEFSRMYNEKQFGAVGVSYKGVSLDVANEINRAIGKLYDEYDLPSFGGIIAPAANTKLGKLLGDATAAYSPVRNSFLLNKKSLGSIKKAEATFLAESNAIKDILANPDKYDLSKASKLFREVVERSSVSGRATVPTNIEEALTHEFGHALESKVTKHPLWQNAKANMGQYADNISGYAGSNYSEYIAESFASYRKGERVCDPTMMEIFDSLKR